MYTPDVTEIVYRDVLAEHVPAVLQAGFSAVVDATCLRQWQRQLFRDLAARHKVPFVIIDVQASVATLRQRIRNRRAEAADPSDADLSVLERQLVEREPLTEDERSEALAVDTDASAWLEALEGDLRRKQCVEETIGT
jgi:hypothetical protein